MQSRLHGYLATLLHRCISQSEILDPEALDRELLRAQLENMKAQLENIFELSEKGVLHDFFDDAALGASSAALGDGIREMAEKAGLPEDRGDFPV